MLVRLDPRTKSISMLSIPRDLRVEIPGYGTDRINAAYSYGGAPLALKTFKPLTGLPVNHFIDINFIGFVDIVDYLGGRLHRRRPPATTTTPRSPATRRSTCSPATSG